MIVFKVMTNNLHNKPAEYYIKTINAVRATKNSYFCEYYRHSKTVTVDSREAAEKIILDKIQHSIDLMISYKNNRGHTNEDLSGIDFTIDRLNEQYENHKEDSLPQNPIQFAAVQTVRNEIIKTQFKISKLLREIEQRKTGIDHEQKIIENKINAYKYVLRKITDNPDYNVNDVKIMLGSLVKNRGAELCRLQNKPLAKFKEDHSHTIKQVIRLNFSIAVNWDILKKIKKDIGDTTEEPKLMHDLFDSPAYLNYKIPF